MKKILVLIVFMLFINPCFANDCNVVCPLENVKVVDNEKLINKVTGVNFLTKQIAEFIIQKELKSELQSNFTANLDIYNVHTLKQGEFKSLTLKSKKIKYKALNMSDFVAKTLCPHNQVIYENHKLYYPNDLAFKFTSKITNDDINAVLNSYEFKTELTKNTLSYGNKKLFEVQTPKVVLNGDDVHFTIPVYSFIWSKPYELNLKTNIEVKDNKLTIKNAEVLSKSNIISISMLSELVNKINPLAYEFDSIDTKYCKILITNAKIENNEMNIEGVFIINKNYSEGNE